MYTSNIAEKNGLWLSLIVLRVIVEWETPKTCCFWIKTWKWHQNKEKGALATLNYSDLSIGICCSRSKVCDTISLIPQRNFKFTLFLLEFDFQVTQSGHGIDRQCLFSDELFKAVGPDCFRDARSISVEPLLHYFSLI